jgi:hypothetical protein
MNQLEKVMSLIAYVDPYKSPHSSLLSSSHKNALAEEVNAYLLGKHSPESLKKIVAVGRWL